MSTLPSPPTVRLQDWTVRLDRWVTEWRSAAFDWGAHDCCTFAAGAVREVTGFDPLGALQWSDVVGAAETLVQVGGLIAGVTARLGPHIAPAWAQRGDLLLLPMDFTSGQVSRESLAVCLGNCCVAPGRGQLQFLPWAAALHAWPVGRMVEMPDVPAAGN